MEHSAQMHWHTAGRGAFANMHFPQWGLLAQTLCKVREEEEHEILLVAPYWPTRTWFPELMLLVTAPPWQIPLRKDLLTQRRGTLWHPRPESLETSCLVPRRDAEVLGDLPQEVVDTNHFGESTVYETRLRLEVEPVRRMVLFSQRRPPEMPDQSRAILLCSKGWSEGCLPSTLKVYVAAIAANHDPVEGKSLGKHDWVVRFLRGARRLNPPRPPSIPSWGPVLSA